MDNDKKSNNTNKFSYNNFNIYMKLLNEIIRIYLNKQFKYYL